MQEFEFSILHTTELINAEKIIESACQAEGLEIGMKGTLAKFAGSIHWHFKKPKERGTLEITLSVRDHRVWANIQSGRRANWIEPCLRKIQAKIEKALKNSGK